MHKASFPGFSLKNWEKLWEGVWYSYIMTKRMKLNPRPRLASKPLDIVRPYSVKILFAPICI